MRKMDPGVEPNLAKFKVEFAQERGLSQDQEWCLVTHQGRQEEVRFHDYARIFQIPGLYEELFYGRLKCDSPRVLTGLLSEALTEAKVAPSSLRGIDLGAGNGMVGEELKKLGVPSLVAVDILPDAAVATSRDRPGTYEEYLVKDLTRLTREDASRLRERKLNLLSVVAALGFGDMPSRAFAAAWSLIETPAWVVFNIKEEFLSPKFEYGFSRLVRRLTEDGALKVHRQRAYRHRLALDGTPLPYVAFVGQKTGPIPESWLAELD